MAVIDANTTAIAMHHVGILEVASFIADFILADEIFAAVSAAEADTIAFAAIQIIIEGPGHEIRFGSAKEQFHGIALGDRSQAAA